MSIALWCCLSNSDLRCSTLSVAQDQSLVSNCLQESITTGVASRSIQMHDILPLSVYHLGLPMNSLTSRTILSATLSSRTTEPRGRRLRGNPKGRHSAPMAVYMTVRPSSCFRASSLAEKTQLKAVTAGQVSQTGPLSGRFLVIQITFL